VIFDPPPKSRRRFWFRFLWPAIVAVAILVAVVVSAAGEETRTELQYLDEMRSQATALARSGASIADVMSRIAELEREEFTTVFENVEADLDVALAFVTDEPPTSSLIPVWALYRQSVQAWSDGVSGLAVAVLQAADDPQDVTVTDAIGNALADLRAGDNLFQNLRSEFERNEIPEPVSPLVDVRLSPSDAGLSSQSVTYVAAARRSTSGLGLRPGLKVSQVLSAPEWEINVESQAVVPATETVVFSTVITNSGNIASEAETVTMQLGGGAEPVLAQAEVPPLRPGGQTTVEFSEVEVLPDILYEILVELELANPDNDMTDNEIRVQFAVNHE
jgi:hypothetical protein